MKNSIYYKQAEFLLRVLPYVNTERVFALKGGTAINFFVRNLPRLSIDIDLAYIPFNKRDVALADITGALTRIAGRIARVFPRCTIVHKRLHNVDVLKGLVINVDATTVKIEPNLVIRGTVFAPEIMELSPKAQDLFQISLTVNALSFSELYAGKICAALDRQHPRDLFDVGILLREEGLTEKIRKAFIIYLISHPRPLIEILNPNPLDIKRIFENELQGMTVESTSHEELLNIRTKLISLVKASLTGNEKAFLISFKEGKPRWDLLGLMRIEELPAVQWKLLNILRMDTSKRNRAVRSLRDYLEI